MISNPSIDVTGVTFTDVLNSNLTLVGGTARATPISVNDTYSNIGNLGITEPTANGILKNDVSPDATAITASVTTDVLHGTLALATDGSFTYTPTTGYVGSDSLFIL